MGFSLDLQYPVPPISYAKFPWHCAKSIILLIDCKSPIQVWPHYSLKSTIHFFQMLPEKLGCLWMGPIPQLWSSLRRAGFLASERHWALAPRRPSFQQSAKLGRTGAAAPAAEGQHVPPARRLCFVHPLPTLGPAHGPALFCGSQETTNRGTKCSKETWTVYAHSWTLFPTQFK